VATVIDTMYDRFLVVPVTFTPTAVAAATCTVALSPDGITFSTLVTKSYPLLLVFSIVDEVSLLIPVRWSVKLTTNANATLGMATYY
jgi:hypothetical protein